MSTIATLVFIQEVITRYAFPIIIGLGNLGNLLIIGIYSQKKYRTSSCSIYLIASSCFCLMAANWAIIPLINALDHFDWVSNSVVVCRIRGYTIHTSSMCFRYTLVLVCADRYALCSTRAAIRALSRPQIAYRLIAGLMIFWSVVSVHILIWESIENGRCYVYGLYGQIFGFYIAIFTGLIPILSMIIFAILLVKNLHRPRSQVQPFNTNHRLNRRDISLIKLVLMEVIVYIICTLLYPPMTIYTQITAYTAPNKNAERKQIESFINFIIMSLLLYLNYNTTFYVHIITSKVFRNEVKNFIIKCIHKLSKNTENQHNTLNTAAKTLTKQPIQRTIAV